MKQRAENGAYLPHYLSIKVREELSLPPRDACQNTDTRTTTSLPNVGIFTTLGTEVGQVVSSQGASLGWWPVPVTE